MARHMSSHSHSHSHAPSSPQSPLNSSSNLASTSTSTSHPTLSNSTLSPASLTPAQPTLSLAHARRSTNNNNQFPSNASTSSNIHSVSATPTRAGNTRHNTHSSSPSQKNGIFSTQSSDQGLDRNFDLHSDFSFDSENPGNVLVQVQGVSFYVHKDVLFFASPFFKSILEGGWAESNQISASRDLYHDERMDRPDEDERKQSDEEEEFEGETDHDNDEEDSSNSEVVEEEQKEEIQAVRKTKRSGEHAEHSTISSFQPRIQTQSDPSRSNDRITSQNSTSSSNPTFHSATKSRRPSKSGSLSSLNSHLDAGSDSEEDSSPIAQRYRETIPSDLTSEDSKEGKEKSLHRIIDEDENESRDPTPRTRSRVRASFHTAHFSLDASDPSADERFHQFLEKRRSDEVDSYEREMVSSEKRKGKEREENQIEGLDQEGQGSARKELETEKALNRLIGFKNDDVGSNEDSSRRKQNDNVEEGMNSKGRRRRSASEGESSLKSQTFRKSLQSDGKLQSQVKESNDKVNLDLLATPPQSPTLPSSSILNQSPTSVPPSSTLSLIQNNKNSISKRKQKLVQLGRQRWEGSVRKNKFINQKIIDQNESTNVSEFSSPITKSSNSKEKSLKQSQDIVNNDNSSEEKFVSSRSVSEPLLSRTNSKPSSSSKGKGKEKDQFHSRTSNSKEYAGKGEKALVHETGRRDLVAVVELHEEEASTFQDFLFHIYPHLDGLVTWKSVQGLMRFGDKFEVPFIRKNCLNFLKQSLAGRPIHAMCLAEEFGLDIIYREASRHVLDNYSNWSNEELDELSRESLIKIERKRSWFLERVLKLSTSNPARDYECQPNCPDSTLCSKVLHEKFRSSYVTAFRFGPPRPSEIWRLLREFDSNTGSNQAVTGSGLYSCLLHSKAWVRLLFDRMFEINQTGGTNNRLFLSIKLESGTGVGSGGNGGVRM